MNSANTSYGIGLGSNLGDRLEQLHSAVERVDALDGVHVTACSQVYQTPPAGGPPQADYYNAAIAIETHLRPPALLEELLSIERDLGRVRPDPVRWGPRTIDLDVLWWSRGVVMQDSLVVPHPRLSERAFVLVPLLEVLPDCCDPMTEQPYSRLPLAQSVLTKVGSLARLS